MLWTPRQAPWSHAAVMCKVNCRQADQRINGEVVKIMQKVPFWFSFCFLSLIKLVKI